MATEVKNNVEQNGNVMNDYQEFVFTKVKQLGKMTYKRIETNVKVFSDKMSIYQENSRLFKKKQIIEKEILLDAIQKAEINTVWDFWDSIYVIIFIALGFVSPVVFLLAIVCVFCAYGKEIELTLSDGTVFNIPCSWKKEVDKLPFKVQDGKTKLFKM